jgi:hypothetical protein
MPNATTPPALIEVFRAGSHTDINAVQVNFSEADLQAIADSYDPAVHEAPLVVGHPKLDNPAYGWAKRFVVQGSVLFAEPYQVEEQFGNLVNEGRFKKVSLAMYSPSAASNPKPGTWYPKHVGFLGAKAPAVKGLKSVQFGEAEDGVHCFGDYAETAMLGMFRRFRDFLLTQFGQETADRVIPSYELDYAMQEQAADQVRDALENTSSEGATPAFAEGSQPGAGDEVMNAQEKAALQAQLDAANQVAADANAKLAARERADAAKAQADAAKAAKAEAVAFAEAMVGQAKLPRERAAEVVAIYEILAKPNAEGSVLQFGEGDQAKSAVDAFKALIDQAKPAVEFGEHAKRPEGGDLLVEGDELAQFAECSDPARLQLARDSLSYQRKADLAGKPITYLEAVKAVQSGRQA